MGLGGPASLFVRALACEVSKPSPEAGKVWWHSSVIPTVGRLRQDGGEFGGQSGLHSESEVNLII